MSTLKKYDLTGKKVGTLTVDPHFVKVETNGQLIKDYIVALRRNARQWSANTKGRSEVSHSNKKPHRQKGTGSARQGSLASPQYRGGGIVFGPKPKRDQHVRINKKERRQAVRALLAEKIKEDQLFLVEDKTFSDALKGPKTKTVFAFLQKLGIQGRGVLFVGEGAEQEVETAGKKQKVSVRSKGQHNFKLSVRNIPRAAYTQAPNLNGYDVLASRSIVMTESAFAQVQELLQP